MNWKLTACKAVRLLFVAKNQFEDTLRGGRQIARSDKYTAPVNMARRWIARFFLSGNVLSAAKQLASVPVWANVVGFRDFGRYLVDIDPVAIKELKESPGYRARYEGGWSEESANIISAQKRSMIAKLYDKGMIVNSAMDAVSGLWIGQGLYRDLKAKYIDQGYSPEEAKTRAQTIVWNLVEQTQQSARTENLTLLSREGGAPVRMLLQFVNSPLQQLQFEIQAMREVHAGTPGAKAALARALIINHVLVPALLLGIQSGFNAMLGKEPEDKDDWQWWAELITSGIVGQWGALFLVGNMGETGIQTLLGVKSKLGQSAGLPVQSAVGVIEQAAKVGHDVAGEAINSISPTDLMDVTTDDLLSDFQKLATRMSAPYRHVSTAVENWNK